MDVKSNHRAAGTFIDINTLHIQGVNRKDIAVGFTLRRRSAMAGAWVMPPNITCDMASICVFIAAFSCG